jgi:KUP system potassium uptake protein
VLYEHIVFLSVRTTGEPRVGTADRLEIKDLGNGASQVVVRYGYMQSPNLPVALRLCERAGLAIDLDDMIYFTGRVTTVPAKGRGGMMRWRQALFAFMNRNGVRPADYMRLPPDRVMELGERVEI